ncbi:unnamed protein product [Coregonus sp. 'balchen']|nr:unnamed protein product [Coregonus sp. 'balchen']
MDCIHKTLIGPGFRLATSPMRKPSSSCVVCRLRFNSESQASSHYSDVTFGPVLSPPSASGVAPSTYSPAVSMETPSDPSLSPCPMVEKEMEGAVEEVGESEEDKAKRLLYCSLCKVAVNSTSQLKAHNSGTKHKTMLEARSGDGAIKSFPRSGVKAKLAPPTEVSTGLQNKTFHCEICDVHVNSETQLKQVGIALRKEQDMAKPLASCLLQRHLSLAAAAAMATLSPFHLRPAPTPGPALFQIQPLPQTLLHPAPGPFRTAHTSVLFSPY